MPILPAVIKHPAVLNQVIKVINHAIRPQIHMPSFVHLNTHTHLFVPLCPCFLLDQQLASIQGIQIDGFWKFDLDGRQLEINQSLLPIVETTKRGKYSNIRPLNNCDIVEFQRPMINLNLEQCIKINLLSKKIILKWLNQCLIL